MTVICRGSRILRGAENLEEIRYSKLACNQENTVLVSTPFYITAESVI